MSVTDRENLSSLVFGRWTVLEQPLPQGKRNQRKWLCRCECGTERYVSDNSLRYGKSISCGCFRRERTSEKNAHDLLGKQFGDLFVVERIGSSKGRNIYWRCRCFCGKEVEVSASHLVCGRKTSCGCKENPGHPPMDITNRRFHSLVALYFTGESDERGSAIWHCRCDCGNELDISYNSLMYSNLKSCGCRKKEHDKMIQDYLSFVADTSIDLIRKKELSINNTTGIKGVYYIRGKYVAKIIFQKKAYYLGSYATLEEAASARKCAEESIYDAAVDHYEKWRSRADAEPDWALKNPIRFSVSKIEGKLYLQVSPEL